MYSVQEIERWFDIRGGSAHADNPARVFRRVEAIPVANRAKQAAIDVAFNKLNWRSPDTAREGRAPIRTRLLPGNHLEIEKDKEGSTKFGPLYDDFKLLPVNFGWAQKLAHSTATLIDFALSNPLFPAREASNEIRVLLQYAKMKTNVVPFRS